MERASTVLFAHEAAVTLYRADAGGNPVTAEPLWLGGCAEGVELAGRLVTDRFAETGAAYAKTYHLDETHDLRFDRLWVLRSDGADAELWRGQELVLDVAWTDLEPKVAARALWHRRRYLGVRAVGQELRSEGIYEFRVGQSFTAERFTETHGLGVEPTGAASQFVFFLSESPVSAGAWLMGAWAFAAPARLRTVLVQAALAGTGDAAFGLLADGADSGVRVVLPAGEARAAAALEFPVAAGARLRWRCLTAPDDPAAAPAGVSLTAGVAF